jgi:hypothetical protein
VKKNILLLAFAMGLRTTHADAQSDSPAAPAKPAASESAEIAELRKQVQQLSETVKALQEKVQARENDALIPKLPEPAPKPALAGSMLDSGAAAPAAAAAPEAGAGLQELQKDVEELKTAQRQVRTGLFNPDISAAADFITSYSRLNNNVNFTMRDIELMLQSNIDQVGRAYIVLNAGTDLDPINKTSIFGDVSVGVEEAAIATTALPYGLVLKGGEFFADFTRLGKVHTHDRPFVDGPSSVQNIIGGETKSRGFELSWLPPSGHYLRLTAGLVDNIGADMPANGKLTLLNGTQESAYADRLNRPLQSLMGYGRAATLFEIGKGAVLHVGADYAQSSQSTKRQIATADVKLEWQPNPASYDMFEAGGEVLWTKESGRLATDAYFGGNPFATSSASGGYVYAQYRIGKAWAPGIRVDYTQTQAFDQLDLNGGGIADSVERQTSKIWTYSAYLTYWASEFNRFRLQVNYVDSDQPLATGKGRNDWQIFLQWTAIMGAHKHDFMP